MRTMYTQRHQRRRGVAAVFSLVVMFVLVGFAALTIDVGAMYNTRADLQRAADAGAMAAAKALTTGDFNIDPLLRARASAAEIVTRNTVLGEHVTLTTGVDVIFGRSNFDAVANTIDFQPTDVMPDAVRVIVRKTEDSPNGMAKLYFSRIFGRHTTSVTAEAIAAISPRDISICADVSGSLLYDSQLERYDDRTINITEVWGGFPGGVDDTFNSTWAPDEVPADRSQAAGPGWGYLKQLAWGTDPAESSYDPLTDPGLIRLPYGSSDWSDGNLENWLLARGYNNAEVDAIMTSDSNSDQRIAVATGLADWNSGMPGGKWELEGVPAGAAGNANTIVGSTEIQWREQIFDRNMTQSQVIWDEYIDYMQSSRRGAFRHRFGIKTFMGFLLDDRMGPDETPEIADVPVQPMEAIKDAVEFMVEFLESQNTTDYVALEAYSRYGYHEIDLSSNFAQAATRLRGMNPDHHGSGTNIGAGMARSIEELYSSRARTSARKVMVVLTDGQANRDEFGNWSNSGAVSYALAQAQRAADLDIQLVTVSVGQDADQDLMRQIANIGNGTHFHAEGDIDEYSDQLISIFAQIGGMHSVQLIR